MASYVRALSSLSIRHRLSLQMMLDAEARFYRNYEGAIIAVSQQISNELQEFYSVRGPITVIPHGVNIDRFHIGNRNLYRWSMRQQMGLKDDDIVALYVGDLTKAHVHLKQLSRVAPGIQFVIVSGTKAYYWQAPNVRIISHSQQIERYYAAADAFVFPSVNDPFGLVVLEAMASGLPVFTSDQAGAAELMDSGKDGFVLRLDEWVESTAATLRDGTRLNEVAKAAAQAAKRSGWSSVVAAVETVYEQVMTGA
jgi:UDP-glucose:(heptosyl)LPS alpha-1,3-glucosyltransferase